MTFQILSLSGGGYRGLFTAEILARLEEQAGRPIGGCFDLIAGTSIGGIIAIGLGMGRTASDIRDAFLENGEAIFPPRPSPPKDRLRSMIAKYRWFIGGPKYDGVELRKTIEAIIDPDALLGEARTRLLIPAVNMTEGRVQMFKTPHAPTLRVDQSRKAVEIALATSAAPTYFPLAKIGSSYFADGGLAANSPDACAVHEASHFAGQSREDVRILSIGTTSARFGLPASLGRRFGPAEWLANERLVSTIFGVQQQLVDFMMSHEYRDQYIRIDAETSADHAIDVGLDVATKERRETLQALAEGAYQRFCTHPLVLSALAHRPDLPEFVGTTASARS
ncbi:cGAMP-activated phospholipase [Methylorubrum aminovorans]|uniref:CGAMP-activated phospholipase n=1 Tax=Methylorubrum aminovorans TaxID=269069 RepID=A0ABQ4UF67_9HYPH|nr:CBASS cGAMP-activated phospholipase [Methylorubrum aminovorans]GJE65965.1 cGAMP-activated phospholipase [Methylorubrum aminovorans]GMA77926.1 patatin [Methylorubrum aminovorans]